MEYSCGGVVYTVTNGVKEFLIIRQKNGNHFGFPKGHMENNEKKEETAFREIKEETGIEVYVFINKHQSVTYSPYPGVSKEVTYFLCEAKNRQYKRQEEEIAEIMWVKHNEVLEKLTYDNDKYVFKKLSKLI